MIYKGNIEISLSAYRKSIGDDKKLIEGNFTEQHYDIPYGVTRIHKSCFENVGLNSVKIPDSVTSISEYAFANNPSLVSVDMSNGVATMGSYVFENCYGLNSITLPSTLDAIPTGCFSRCYAIKSFDIPVGVTQINDNAFDYSGLQSINIPTGVAKIGKYAFSNTNLQSVSMSDSVTQLGDYTFYQCTSLSQVRLSTQLRHIPQYAFSKCTSLESIAISFPTNDSAINAYAFQNSGLKSIEIPPVSTIGSRAFASCTGLTNVVLSEGGFTSAGYTANNQIAEYAFDKCSNLETINFPSDLTAISNFAFRDCNKLNNVSLPTGLTSLGNGVFQGCASFTSIDIPDGVSTLSNDVLASCHNLRYVALPANIATLGSYWMNTGGNVPFESFTLVLKGKMPTNVNSLANLYPSGTPYYIYLKATTVQSTTSTILTRLKFNEATKIYVPANLVDTYKATAPYSTYAGKIEADPT